MKLIWKVLSISTVSLMLWLTVMTVQARDTEASSDQNGVVVTKGAVLNVRAGKGTDTAVVGKVKNGEKLRVLETSGDWYQVKLSNGKVGYVLSKFLKVDGQPKTAEKPESTAESDQGVGVVTASILNIREKKDTSAKSIGKLKKGDELQVLDSADEWYKVKLSNGKVGYAFGSYIKMGSADAESSDSNSSKDSKKDAEGNEETGVVSTDSSALNIRADKNTSAKVVGSAAKGTKVKILEKSGDWYKVELDNGTQGYAKGQFIKPAGEADHVVKKLDKTTAESAKTSATEGVVVTKGAPLNIRATKNTDAKVVDKVAKGTKLQILEEAGEWYKVKLANGKTGYASSQFIQTGATPSTAAEKVGDGEEGVVITKSAPLNIRADQDASAKVVGQAEKGAKLQILEKSGEWYKVKLKNGTTGYASSKFIQAGTAAAADDNAEADKSSLASKTSNYGVVNTKTAPLNVRATKDSKAKIVGKADKGSKVLILEKSGDWYKVQLKNGTKGYASSQFIKEEE